jgi:predicted O-methyltransferase YrrM
MHSDIGQPEPTRVATARARARELGFELSSEPGVGALLATLAAALPLDARVIELGTGAGVGLAWIVYGLGERTDVHVVTVDTDADLSARTQAGGWPAFVRFVVGDGAAAVAQHAPAQLVFADAPGGKIDGLEHTIAALASGGILVVDDMDPALHTTDGYAEPIEKVRHTLMNHPDLVATELTHSSGVIVAVRRRQSTRTDNAASPRNPGTNL